MLRAGPKRGSGHELYVATPNPVDREESCREYQNSQGNEEVPEDIQRLEIDHAKKRESGNECHDNPIRDQKLAEIGNNRVTHAKNEKCLKADRIIF